MSDHRIQTDELDATFAHDGDRTLTYWIVEHERFFLARCGTLGLVFDTDLEVVLERFEVVWHPNPAPRLPRAACRPFGGVSVIPPPVLPGPGAP